MNTTPLELPVELITLDMDGTLDDPWTCCGGPRHPDRDKDCIHRRLDTFERIAAIQADHPDCGLVILSYRQGTYDLERTQKFAAAAGLDIKAWFLAGMPDTEEITSGYARLTDCKIAGYGQVAHKLRVVLSLIKRGHTVLAAFDDNQGVIDALSPFVGEAHHVAYTVNPESHEWSAGYIGAPKPSWAYTPREPTVWEDYGGWTPKPYSEANDARTRAMKHYAETGSRNLLDDLRYRQAQERPLLDAHTSEAIGEAIEFDDLLAEMEAKPRKPKAHWSQKSLFPKGK